MIAGKITRRIFLRSLTWLGAIGLVRPSYILGEWTRGDEVENIVSGFNFFFKDSESAAVVGRAYLDQNPGEADVRLLVDRICSDREGEWRGCAGKGPEKLRSLFRKRVREDFGAGRTVMVKGWILSETEARLCAIAALKHDLE